MQFGPGFIPTFLYYASTTAIVFSLVTMKGMGLGLETGLPQQVGLTGGLIAGLLGGYFNSTMTLTMPVNNKKEFFNILNNALSQMGYQQKDEMDGVLVYERSGLSKFLSGKVFVQIDHNTATIASRAVHIRGLRKLIQLSSN
jgi:hypothetical protein